MPSADDRLLREAAGLLAGLAPRHGISVVQLGAGPAELVVTLEEGRTYFDLAEFEAEALLPHRVSVTSSGAPGAHSRKLLAPATTCVSRPEEVAAQLGAAIHGVEEVRRVVPEGDRAAFDASEDRSRALAFCWVSTGSTRKHHAQMTGAPQGAPPVVGTHTVP